MGETIARWESKTGKWSVTLNSLSERAYSYSADGSGGVFYADDTDAATAHVQTLVDMGLFQPDANRTPMRRVTVAGASV